MWKSDEIIDKLHEIRETLYEERKTLNPREEIDAINSSVEEIEKEYGFKFKKVS